MTNPKCTLCDIETPKYKCPNCRIPYCSVKCWRIHRDEGCEKVAKETQPKAVESQLEYFRFPTNDTVPPERLKLLGQSQGVLDTLHNPHVRNILDLIDKSERPTYLLQDAMREPIFIQFVEECMKVIEPEQEPESD